MTDRRQHEHQRSVGPPPSTPARPSHLSLEQLYRKHASFVWRVVRRFGIPDEAAEDVVQEVFIVARRKLPDFEGRSSPSTWLYGLARGICANTRRAAKRAERRRHRMSLLPPVHVPGPDEVIGREGALELVERFLGSLLPEQRAVFELVDIEGMSGPDTALALGLSLNLVYSRLRLARRRFEKFVADNHPHSETGAP